MPVTESQVAGLELERVLPKLRRLFDMDDKFYAFIRKRPAEKVSNRQMRIPLEISPGGDFGYFDPDGGDLGRGSGPTFDKAVVNVVFIKTGIEWTKLVDWATDDARKAIVQGVRRITASAFDEMRRQLDAQLMGDGTGVIGVISVVSTTAGVDTYTLGTDGFGARRIRTKQIVQVFDTTLATLRGSGRVTGVDVNAKTVTVEPAIAGAVATDKLVVQGINAPAALPALFGVAYHHSSATTGTWLGFNRATTPEIRANRVNANSAPFTLALPRLAMYAVSNRLGMDNNFRPTAWMHPAQASVYEEMGQLMTVINSNGTLSDKKLDLYFGGNMQMAGAQVKVHNNWDKTRIDFILEDVWGRAEMVPLDYYRTDGRKLFEIRGASGGVATAEIFYLVVGMQTYVTNPAACAYIDGLAVPTGY